MSRQYNLWTAAARCSDSSKIIHFIRIILVCAQNMSMLLLEGLRKVLMSARCIYFQLSHFVKERLKLPVVEDEGVCHIDAILLTLLILCRYSAGLVYWPLHCPLRNTARLGGFTGVSTYVTMSYPQLLRV